MESDYGQYNAAQSCHAVWNHPDNLWRSTMTEGQKTQIMNLRRAGYGYVRIAQELEMSENTVKSFCRRNKVAGKVDATHIMLPPAKGGKHFCLCCGEEVEQNPGRKEKKFCSDRCRNRWWNSHLDRVERRANYEFVCLHCQNHFTAYGNAKRKYCSHECYIAHRFGGETDE